jgi:hypothetical protein
MAPDVELRNPSLMLSPEVSTQLFPPEAVSPSEDFEPHPVRMSAADNAAAVPATSLARDFTTGFPFVLRVRLVGAPLGTEDVRNARFPLLPNGITFVLTLSFADEPVRNLDYVED